MTGEHENGFGAPRLEARGRTWAIALAGGEGTRLSALTAYAAGERVPKQFCSLRTGPSLLQQTLRRGTSIAGSERLCAIVARQHRAWWAPCMAALPRGNVIVQPENRGTANGMLLVLLRVLERDPDARIVFLPSDHHVEREPVIAAAVERAVRCLAEARPGIVLLGMIPEEPDTELGYIVPGRRRRDGLVDVRRFVEKPVLPEAARLVGLGALWNVFIVAARARALLDLFLRLDADLVVRMRRALRRDGLGMAGGPALAALYHDLRPVDFSRDIAMGNESSLALLEVPACGWSDLGTPERVAKALQRFERSDAGTFGGEAGAPSLELGLRRRDELLALA